MPADPPAEGELVGVDSADEVGVAVGVPVGVAVGVTASLAAACVALLLVEEFLALDGVGEAAGPLHPAATTQRSNTAHTASIAACFFIKLAPRVSD
jgi:hypothetical protein